MLAKTHQDQSRDAFTPQRDLFVSVRAGVEPQAVTASEFGHRPARRAGRSGAARYRVRKEADTGRLDA